MPIKTAIKVISLNDSARRTSFLGPSNSNLDWSFFSAFQSIEAPLSYDEATAKRRFGRILSASEIGCYTSHFKCWEWLVNSPYDQIFIFEDDTLIDWAAINELAEHDFTSHKIDFLRLFTTHPVNWKIIKFRFLSPHYHLIRTTGTVFGTQGYMLTKRAARQLVRHYKNISVPVDWVLTRYWEHQLVNYCVFPFPVIERHIASSIGDNRNTHAEIGLYDKMFYILWRIRNKWMRVSYAIWKAKSMPLGKTIDVGPAFLKKLEDSNQNKHNIE